MSVAVHASSTVAPAPPVRRRALTVEDIGHFAQVIAAQLELPALRTQVMARTRALCDADGASLLLVDANNGQLVFDVVAGGSGSAIVQRRVAIGEGIAGRVAQLARPLLVRDFANCSFAIRFEDLQFVPTSIVAVPLVLAGDVIGVLEIVRGGSREPFDDHDVQRLELLAPHVAIAVHNSRIAFEIQTSRRRLAEANEVLEQRIQRRTAQLAAGKREWEATFDAISEPMAIISGGTVRRANLAYARAVGLPIEQVVGRKCYAMKAARASACSGCPIADASAAEGATAELMLGTRLYIVRTHPIPDSEPASVVVRYQDITDARAALARQQQVERMASIGQLASGAAHEINNPIAVVQSNLSALSAAVSTDAEPLASPEGVAELREMVSDAQAATARVSQIVLALREMSRLEIGAPAVIDLSKAIAFACRDAGRPVELRGAAANSFRMQPLQLDRTLRAILRNAVQATPAEKAIWVHHYDRGDEVWIEIGDEGAGIQPEHLGRVFEPFFTTRPIGSGVGLGLTAAYGMVQQAGGAIDVRSEPGQGTIVTLRFPRRAT